MSGASIMAVGWKTSSVVLGVSTIGILSVLAISWVNGSLRLDEEESGATTLGAFAFPVALLAPFLVLIASCWLHDAGQRRSIWLGCTLSTLVLAVLAMFSVGILYLLIALAIGWAWLASFNDEPTAKYWLSPVLTLWIALTFGSSLLFPLFRPDTPACWTSDGWESTESFSSGIATSSSNATTCSSDITDSLEGAVSLGTVALGILGMIAILRLWQVGQPQPPTKHRMTQQYEPR
jgi:hypothetical protein